MEFPTVPLDAPEAADPARFGPKAANLALLCAAGLPTPGGYAVDAGAYRAQLAALGLEATAREVFAAEDRPRARRCALDMKLGLMDRPVASPLIDPLVAAWREVTVSGARGVVRSSALVEDRADSSFAGQFESFLELQ
ncbi:MAG TPA: PEP/pyruvate-binding domain-containing protein, partial [Burkholderiales bacterium]|nr:PEP/pyruvate-binding domain-containing protein [Burkholderiales bacterium]